MDLRRLRDETRPDHEATEAAMPLTEPGLTLETYRAVLALLLPVLKGWEAWAAQNAPAGLLPLLSARRRSHWIEQDLQALDTMNLEGNTPAAVDQPGVDWNAVVFDASIPQASVPGSIEREAAFLGAFYVLEGSTLGGRFIARHAETTLGLSPGEGDAYFRGHGEHTGALWRETTEAIAALPEQVSEITIASARRTFQAFGAILGTRPAAGLAVHG